jgi:hypothetical protein
LVVVVLTILIHKLIPSYKCFFTEKTHESKSWQFASADELILKFTHDREIDYLIPGIAPTEKYVELPHVVIMKFVGNKIVHEHIYWD